MCHISSSPLNRSLCATRLHTAMSPACLFRPECKSPPDVRKPGCRVAQFKWDRSTVVDIRVHTPCTQTCTHTSTHTYAHTMHTHTQVHTHAHIMHTNMHTHKCTHTYAHKHRACTQTCVPHKPAGTHACFAHVTQRALTIPLVYSMCAGVTRLPRLKTLLMNGCEMEQLLPSIGKYVLLWGRGYGSMCESFAWFPPYRLARSKECNWKYIAIEESDNSSLGV